MTIEKRTAHIESMDELECPSQSSLAQVSTDSWGIMSWTESGSEGSDVIRVDSLPELIKKDEQVTGTSQTTDPEQKAPDQASDSSEKSETSQTVWSLDLPLNYGNGLKSFLHVKGTELEEHVHLIITQFTENHINLPIFLVSSVLLLTVGVFIGRRSGPEML